MSALQIAPNKPAGQELGRVLIDLATEAGHCVRSIQSDPHEAIHRLRTSMKKLRSGLFLGRWELPSQSVGEILDATVFLKNSVAAYRDREVLRRWIARLAMDIETANNLPGFFQNVSTDLYPVFFPALQEIEESLLAALTRKSHGLRRLLERTPFWVVTRRGLAESLEFTHAKVLRWRKVCRKSGGAVEFHEWRKAVKHQATQCLMLEKLFPDAGKFLRQAETLGESLGTMNDLENLHQLLLGCPVSSPCLPPIMERIKEELESHKKRALRLARNFR